MEPSVIVNKIYTIRDRRVMLDFDLAELFGVETRALKQAVRRNMDRFPDDFMFECTEQDIENMVSQFVIPHRGKLGGALPFAFTENGVAMLSSVLKSKKAIQMNIVIMRAFIALRNFALAHKDLAEKINGLELKYDKQFNDIYEALNYLIKEKQKELKQEKRARIGFKKDEE